MGDLFVFAACLGASRRGEEGSLAEAGDLLVARWIRGQIAKNERA